MKKLLIGTNIVMFIIMLIFDVRYMLDRALSIKFVASSMFVIAGMMNLAYCIKQRVNLKFPLWMMTGVVYAMLGDLFILTNFYLAATTFALAHIFYFVSYCMLEKINRRDWLYGISFPAIAVVVLSVMPGLTFGSPLIKGICYVYSMIMTLMLGKALSNLSATNTPINKVIAIGSTLFFISDFMLLLDRFGGISAAGYACLGIYYPAQFVLAWSIYVYGSEKEDVSSQVAKERKVSGI